MSDVSLVFQKFCHSLPESPFQVETSKTWFYMLPLPKYPKLKGSPSPNFQGGDLKSPAGTPRGSGFLSMVSGCLGPWVKCPHSDINHIYIQTQPLLMTLTLVPKISLRHPYTTVVQWHLLLSAFSEPLGFWSFLQNVVEHFAPRGRSVPLSDV